jgi:hypothetical protein
VDRGKVMGSGNKKMKMDLSDSRLQCRVSCGADHVLENVFPYLLPPDYVRPHVDEDGNDNDYDAYSQAQDWSDDEDGDDDYSQAQDW